MAANATQRPAAAVPLPSATKTTWELAIDRFNKELTKDDRKRIDNWSSEAPNLEAVLKTASDEQRRCSTYTHQAAKKCVGFFEKFTERAKYYSVVFDVAGSYS